MAPLNTLCLILLIRSCFLFSYVEKHYQIVHCSDPQVRQYLESVVHSQMFDMFVESRMHTLKKKQHDGVPPARLFAPRSSSSFDMMMSFYQAQGLSIILLLLSEQHPVLFEKQ